MKILLIEDDTALRGALEELLSREQYDVIKAANACSARGSMQPDIDLVMLDVGLPDEDGISLCRLWRKEGIQTPILFLTARSLESDKESAYLGGGDDYLVKPFSSTELLLKITSLLRRYTIYRGKEKDKNIVSLPCDVEVDVDAKIIRRAGEEVSLRDKENEIFFYLLSKRGETVETDRIYEDVWGERAMPSSANNVMVNMLNIRKKLEDNPSNPKLIKTVWGKGYRFE